MEDNELMKSEYEYATKINSLGYLPGPGICSCGCKKFSIQNLKQNYTSGICFRCTNSSCRKRYNIRQNSFFEKHPNITLQVCSEVIKYFICFEMNVKDTEKYIKEEKGQIISFRVIGKIFRSIREVLYKYLYILYQHELLLEENMHLKCSIDESLFTHSKNGEEVWVLGIINNQDKNEFRLEATTNRNSATLKKFIEKYIGKGNTIVSDGWPAYSFLDQANSGYDHDTHNHGHGDFGFGLNSTSSIESLWSSLKSKIKKTYHNIPSKNFIRFLKESEWKYINRNKTYDQKIKEFFDCFNFLQNVKDVEFEKNQFLSDTDLNDEGSLSDNDE